MRPVEVLGVHKVNSGEDLWLIEIEVGGAATNFDFADVKQELENTPPDLWQVAYDERLIARCGGKARFAFFFHFLDLSKPLITAFGQLTLPCPTPIPKHLLGIDYIKPC